MSYYPPEHHPVFFLRDALLSLGADAEFNGRDDRTEGCWGLIVNGSPVAWLIDNRWPHERVTEDPAAQRLLERGVLVCCAQKPDADRVGARWLPLAATPGYRPIPARKRYDVAFVGYVRDATRASVLTDIGCRYNLLVGEGLFGDDAVHAYCSARCAVNIPTNALDENAYDSANMRFWEVLATGTPLITQREPYFADLGIENATHVRFYDDFEHLLRLIGKCLEYPDTAQAMADNGRVLVEQGHTYTHRAKQVLAWLQP